MADILLGNVFTNRVIIQNAFENAEPIIEADNESEE